MIPLDTLFGKSPLSSTETFQPFSLAASKSLSTPTGTPYYHCCLDVRAFVASPCAPGETAELYFSLYNKAESRFITEEYCLILNHLGSPARDSEQRLGRLRTLFTDLKVEDVTDPIYLVCRLVRNGAMKMNPVASSAGDTLHRSTTHRRLNGNLGDSLRGSSMTLDNVSDDSFSVTSGFGDRRGSTVETATTMTHQAGPSGKVTYRRPLGCAVLELVQLLKLEEAHEFSMPIFVPKEEGAFATLHEDIIHDRVKEFEKSPRWVTVSIGQTDDQGRIHRSQSATIQGSRLTAGPRTSISSGRHPALIQTRISRRRIPRNSS